MTPKEKAKDLVELFSFNCRECDNAKLSALIAVDEILDDDMYDMSQELFENRINYWQQVKQEIENL
jgi:hypothetical protein